jgi:hypothetical protein
MATYTNYQMNPNYQLNGSYNSSGESVMFGAFPQAKYDGFSSSSLNPAATAGSSSFNGAAPAPPQATSFQPNSYPAPPNNSLVPSYGPPPTQQSQQRDEVSEMNSELQLDEIIRAQSRALEQARRQQSSPSSSHNHNNNNHNIHHMVSNQTGQLQIHVPASRNQSGSDAVHPDKKKMKKARKLHTVAGGATGALCGTLILGPVGTILGGAAGAYGSNKLHKNGERRAQRKYEQRSVQHVSFSE